MASSEESRKKIVLKKYRTELRSTLSQCIADVLPDLESSGAIDADQRDKVREYVEGKMPANAVDYLMDDHMTKPLSDEGFLKLLGVMKKAPKCSPHCKALATVMEEDLVNGMPSIVDEITKAIERLGTEKTKLQEAIEARTRRWENYGVSCKYKINGYGGTSSSSTSTEFCYLKAPLFLANGPNDEVFVRDYSTQRLVVFVDDGSDRLKYSHYLAGKGKGNGLFQDITGIAASTDCLYVADSELSYIQKLKLNGGYVKQIGSSGSGDGQFNMPFGITLDEYHSRLYICDYDNHRIQVFENDKFTAKFGSKGASHGYFNHPGDITLNNAKDCLYITDLDNNRIQVFNIYGTFIKVFRENYKNDILHHPFGICFTNTSALLITSVHDHELYLAASDGSSITTSTNSFDCPCGVIMMNNGQIVVANMLDNSLTVL